VGLVEWVVIIVNCGLDWMRSVSLWVGLDWVRENGPRANSETACHTQTVKKNKKIIQRVKDSTSLVIFTFAKFGIPNNCETFF